MLDTPFGLASPFLQDPFHTGGIAGFPDYSAGGVEPTLVLDFCASQFAYRNLDETDYVVDDVTPTLVLDFQNGFEGSRPLDVSDYTVDGQAPGLVLDLQNKFSGAS